MNLKIFLLKLKNLINTIFDKAIRIILFPISILFFLLIIAISPKLIIRLGRFRCDKIGHLSLEYEIHLNEKKKLINIPKKKYLDIWFKSKTICNKYYYKLRKENFFIFPNFIFNEVYFLIKFFKMKDRHSPERENSDSDTNYLLDHTKSIINLNDNFLLKNEKILRQYGLKEYQKIICIHLRDRAYRGYSSFTDYKNIKEFKNYIETINYLLSQNFFVVRTGRAGSYKFDIDNNNFLDYPFSKIISDEMDIYFASKCFFCISSGSGFDGLVRSFRRPVLFTNFVPIGYFHSFSKKNMTIFKHHIEKNTNKKLSVKEILKMDLISNLDGNLFEKKNVFFKENTSDEILEATKDMLQFINSDFKKSDFIQDANVNNFFTKEIAKKKNYSMHKKVYSFIPGSFLKKNMHLFN